MATALITGGAGFIGSNLVDRVLAEGLDVVVIDDFSHGKAANLEAATDYAAQHGRELTVITEDIRDCDAVAIMQQYRPQVIFHLGAQIDVRSSVEDPINDAELNILATLRLAQAAIEVGGVHRFIHTSSGGAIYGRVDDLPVSEDVVPDPESPYAVSKYAGELYLRSMTKLHGLSTAYIAPANVYGPRQDPHGEAGVVAIFCQRLLAGDSTRVFGEGTNTRDYVYVEDVVDAFWRAAALDDPQLAERTAGMRFNIGTGVETTDRQLHTLVAEAAGVADDPEYAPARLGDVPRSCLDPSRAKELLGWKPQVSLAQGIGRLIEFMREK